MLGRETQFPDHLTYHVLESESSIHEYVEKLVERMRAAHDVHLREAVAGAALSRIKLV